MEKQKLFCYNNLDYLCSKNNIDKNELRKKLDMSNLQFSAIGWPRASQKIASYFNVDVTEFLYSDLSVPICYRKNGNQWKDEFFKKSLLKSKKGKMTFSLQIKT